MTYAIIGILLLVVVVVYYLSKNKGVDEAVVNAANAEKDKVAGAVTSEVNKVTGEVKQTVTDEIKKI